MNGNTATGYNRNKYLYYDKELQGDVFTGSSFNWFDYGASCLNYMICQESLRACSTLLNLFLFTL